jgi:O-antigen/teichoic acid export membrane protein
MSKSLSDQSMQALFWLLIDKVGSSSINFAITIILARLLTPEDFGLVAMVLIFFELSSTFIESGFFPALVREKEISEKDKSTTFTFNLLTAIVVYGILFWAAPAIAALFEQEALTLIVRIMGFNLIIYAFSIIQRAHLTQQIDFKTQTKVRFVAVVISGSVAIFFAMRGLGVWSLIIKILLMAFIDTALLWIVRPWSPRLTFYGSSFKKLFGFGYKILLSSLLDKFYQQIYKLLIGKYFSSATLGFYTQASNFSNILINTLFRTLEKVTYPVLAKLQDSKTRLKSGYRKVIKMSSFVIIPSMVVLGVLARPLIFLLMGEKWLPAVPFLQLLCLSGITYHFSQINLNMLLVLGRSDLGLKLEIIKKIMITLAIVVGIQFGIYGLVIGEVIAAYVNLIINAYYSKVFLKYSLSEQIKDVFFTLTFSLVCGLLIYMMITAIPLPVYLQIGLACLSGGILYISLHLLFKTEEMKTLREVIIPKTLSILHSNSSLKSAINH